MLASRAGPVLASAESVCPTRNKYSAPRTLTLHEFVKERALSYFAVVEPANGQVLSNVELPSAVRLSTLTVNPSSSREVLFPRQQGPVCQKGVHDRRLVSAVISDWQVLFSDNVPKSWGCNMAIGAKWSLHAGMKSFHSAPAYV
jgi:hypothetical protein